MTPSGGPNVVKSWGPARIVIVERVPGTGLGLSIVGGKVDSKMGNPTSGIFIKNVLPESPAGKTKQLFTGDQIVEINDIRLETSDQQVAVQAIKSAGDSIKFVVRSLQQHKSDVSFFFLFKDLSFT